MNYTDTINFVHSIPKFQRPLGNTNLKKLLNTIGNPQKQLKFIHIAGTNGKGSTASMIAEILKNSNYKTGLFTSPYIEVFNERIRINGENISDNDLIKCVSQVKTAMEESKAFVSEFAFITAVSFLYFHKQDCDFVVLEVGMGGRLDATNVIDDSLISVICKIGIDHTQYLGDTIEEITNEKCGIIRKNGTVVSYPNDDAIEIIKKHSKENNASLTVAKIPEITDGGFIYNGTRYNLSLKGSYQAENAAVVLEVINALRKKGLEIPKSAIKSGLSNTKWPARFEFISDNVVIDGGHNLDGIRALKKSLTDLNRDVILLLAMMEDKDYESCIREIAPIAKTVVATQLDIPRCLDSETISHIVSSINIPVIVNNNPISALSDAISVAKDAVVCVCGSLYLAGEIRKNFPKTKK